MEKILEFQELINENSFSDKNVAFYSLLALQLKTIKKGSSVECDSKELITNQDN